MSSDNILETDRLILRQWRDSDRSPFAQINSDPRVMQFMPGLLSAVESNVLVDKVESHFKQHEFGLFAVDAKPCGTFIGFIGFNVPTFQTHFTPSVEIGWRLSADFWGQGLATEGARAAVQYGFEIIGLREIVAFTVPQNLRSRRVMVKLRMTHDPADDFDHPNLLPQYALRRHVLYRLLKPKA